MTEEIKNWTKYRRSCLEDADTIKKDTDTIAIESTFEKNQIIDENYIKTHKQTEQVAELIKKAQKQKESPLSVEICPVKINQKYQGQHKKTDFGEIYPYWIPAELGKDAKLYPPGTATPYFVRDYLEPTFCTYKIAKRKDVDTALQNTTEKRGNWAEYWKYAEELFKKVTNKSFFDFYTENNEIEAKDNKSEITLHIREAQPRGLAKNIIELYSSLESTKEDIKLYNNISQPQKNKKEELPAYSKILTSDIAPGHFSCQFPLAPSQRKSLYASLNLTDGEIHAVTGPPGTGKTTLLQDILASIVVNSVIQQEDVPLIVASSTNNQAITNILESFKNSNSSDDLSSRWLDGIGSLGLYLTSNTAKSSDYTIAQDSYLNGFVNDYQKEVKNNISSYQKNFLEKFNKCFNKKQEHIAEAKNTILDRIKQNTEKIKNAISVSKEYQYELPEYKEELDFEANKIKGLEEEKNNIKYALSEQDKKIATLEDAEKELISTYKELPLSYKILGFLPSVKQIISSRLKLCLNKYKIRTEDKYYGKYRKLLGHILLMREEREEEKQKILDSLSHLEEVIKQEKAYLDLLRTKIESAENNYKSLINDWNNDYKERLDKLYASTGEEYKNLSPTEDINIRLEISYKYENFWLAIHYREAEYLEKIEALKSPDKPERSKERYRAKLTRTACLFPIFISTFHSLPRFATYYDGKENYYYNLFDYILVDEAGQVSPDVGIASFSLAKKAIVVGDALQIEPVWSMTREIDIVNLKNAHLVHPDMSAEDFWESLESTGQSCSTGNLMSAAQNRCKYEDIEDKTYGTILLEHRRCKDDIIEYCNRYIYANRLKPKAGNSKNPTGLPLMGYMHIPGKATRAGSSWQNEEEAETVAAWIEEKKEELEKKYNKNIEDIIAVVTPYKNQATLIKKKLKSGLKKITVGTVHSLQGAERSIVIFSTVLNKGQPTGFININMLNVAVSRAKHSFFVFGDTALINPEENTPLGNLGKHLFSFEDAELSNKIYYQKKKEPDESFIEHVDTLEGHIENLKKAFMRTDKELIIVSPFISIEAVKHDKIDELIKQKTQEGKNIIIVTDKYLDKYRGRLKDNSSAGRKILIESGAKLYEINGIHRKTIIVDKKILIEGSFNWLSASRDKNSRYYREEASIAIYTDIEGAEISKKIIEDKKKELEKLIRESSGPQTP